MTAPVVGTVSANDPTDFATALNAYLAALVNPTILRIDVTASFAKRQLGRLYSAIITSTPGGPTLATPFTVQVFEEQNVAAVGVDINDAFTANPGYYYPPPRLISWYYEHGSLEPKVAGLLFQNATLAASANWDAG
jgi:hypothetical protein